MNEEILEITKKFHDTYEKLSKEYNYETKKETRVFDINSSNGKLMYATVNEIISPILEENQELKKQLEERKYYKFYKYENNPCGSDYCFCERPCDSNMNLKCFFENGEICGFMSETLVSNHDNIEEISLNEFAHDFIKPLINANFQNKNQQKELIKYLEDEIKELQKIKETELDYDILKDVISQLLDYKEILQKYKETIGVLDEKEN